MDVKINTRNCTFEAIDSATGEVVTAITWDWARERGARFRAELLPVAVDPHGSVADEPPGGWVEAPIKTKVVDGEEVVVQTVKQLPTGLDGWTISERWKLRAWSPLVAQIVAVVVGQDGKATVNGSEAGPGALAARQEPGTFRACRFTRADGLVIDDVILASDPAVLELVEV